MMKDKKSGSGQCSAITKSGKQCRRSSVKFGRYCKQHSEMLQESLWGHHGTLTYIPDAPPVLSQMAAGYWHQYCRALLDHQKLKGHYLSDIFEICWRHDFRNYLIEEIDERGLVNEYPSGAQLNGFDKTLYTNDKRITDLKKQFGLTLDSESKLSSGKDTGSAKGKRKANLKSINGKDW